MSKKYHQKQNKTSYEKLNEERLGLLQQINDLTEKPLIILSGIWIGLIIYEFIYGLNKSLETTIYLLWAVFVLDFLIEFTIAPYKQQYIHKNIITLVSLFLPAFRIFRIFRVFRILQATRAIRSISLVRMLTSFNHGIKAVRRVIGSRGIGYIATLTFLITFAGAAGIFYFENPEALKQNGYNLTGGTYIQNYGDALWLCAMLMVTIGSDYWPKTAEGRILTFTLSLYAFAIFGYITATIASFLIGTQQKMKA